MYVPGDVAAELFPIVCLIEQDGSEPWKLLWAFDLVRGATSNT